MPFGVLTGVAAAPAIVGTTEAVRQGQRQNEKEKHRSRKMNLVVNLPKKNSYSQTFDGAQVVLKNNKLYVDISYGNFGHPYQGYYMAHPHHQTKWKAEGLKGEGMVSTIQEDPPQLNWLYVDWSTHEVKYGDRNDVEDQWLGPWDCTDVEKRITFEGWEGFIAVQEDEENMPNQWALYFDRDDSGLRSLYRIGNDDKRMLYVQLTRREMQKTKKMAEEEAEEKREREKNLGVKANGTSEDAEDE